MKKNVEKNVKVLVVGALVVLLLGVAALCASLSSSSAREGQTEKAKKIAALKKKAERQSRIEKRRVKFAKHLNEIEAGKTKSERKPRFDLDAAEEAKLDAEQAKLLAELRAALDQNEKGWEKLKTLVKDMQNDERFPHGWPRLLKLETIRALSWYIPDSLPELIAYFMDKDPEVIKEATSIFEDALMSADLTASQISQLIISAAQCVDDRESLDSIFGSFMELPNDIFVATAKEILKSGTAMAKEVLPDNIDMRTFSEDVHTAEKLDAWLTLNPNEEEGQVIAQ